MFTLLHDYTDTIPYEFNTKLLDAEGDLPIEEYAIIAMKEFEAIENINILKIEMITDQDEIDYNYHTININYKKKDVDNIAIPKYKYIANSCYGELRFSIRVKTNMNEKLIEKRILVPLPDDDGYYIIGDKRWKPIWQLCDGSVYSQRGKITYKSRMPIIIYKTKERNLIDHLGNIEKYCSYSYALNTKTRRNSTKTNIKFMNPLMIFAAKIGIEKTIEFFGYSGLIKIVDKIHTHKDGSDDTDIYMYYIYDKLFIKVSKSLMSHEIIQNFLTTLQSTINKDFPIDWEYLNNPQYWVCRIGLIGSIKNKVLTTFEEKGKTAILMIERLLDNISILNLRLPRSYKHNVYYVLRWLVENYDSLKDRSNMDLEYKRLRKNEYIVQATLGKKISININKLIEKKNKSRMNDMETLLELFNFNSDIIVSGMKNIGDLIKSDELVNDLTFLQDIAFSSKGPNSMGESSSNRISSKYREIHPSFMGRIDINTSSNSDPGMSGSLTPFAELYEQFYFGKDPEPCDQRFYLEQIKTDYYASNNMERIGLEAEMEFDSLELFMEYLYKNEPDVYEEMLKYEKIEIVEKEQQSRVVNKFPLGTNIMEIDDQAYKES